MNKKNRKRSRKLKAALFYSFNTCLGLLFMFPLIYMLISSFNAERSLPVQIQSFWEFFPSKWTLNNFANVFTRIPMLKYIGNTLLYALGSVIIGMLVNSLAGYALAKFNFTGKKFLLNFIVIMLIIPFEGITLSLYIVVNRLELLNTPFAIILPSLMSCFYIFMFRQFFLGVPNELLEAAEVDGAGPLRTYFGVVLPTAVPVFITVFVLDFFAKWNDFYWPMLTLTNKDLFNVQLAITAFNREPPYHFGEVMASLSIVTIPIIVMFLFLQKYYISGIATTGIKE